MKRRMLVALAIALACPALAAAQEEPAPPSRLTISPFLGYAFTYTQKGTVRFTDQSGSSAAADYERQVKGGVMPGVELEFRAPGRLGFSAAVAYNKRGQESLSTDFVDVAPMYSNGGKMWFMRGAVTMDLLDDDDMRLTRPRGQIRVGPAMVHEVPDAATGRAAYNAVAINGAASGELPLPWKGLGVRGTFEDYMAYLPKGDVGAQLAADANLQTGGNFSAELSGGATHIYVVQVGLAYHF